MIPLSRLSVQTKSWQQQLAQAITDPLQLIEILQLPASLAAKAKIAGRLFPLKVTRDYLDCINKGDPTDPLLRQVLPLADELLEEDGFAEDPVGDMDASVVPGLIHKYHGRVLLITTPACAIHCRYCFRRHYPYQAGSAHGQQINAALAYIGQHEDLSEVILSGGDPLSLSDEQLHRLVNQIEKIRHITTIRIHTRLPVVLPQRMTTKLLELLSNSRLNPVMVIHCNHPNELSVKVLQALSRARSTGLTILNQSVLLNGVNDNPATLMQLSQKLFSVNVLPYYLHMLDPVSGASHFNVDKQRAITLLNTLKNCLPGYLVPKLVEEKPGQPSKDPVF